MVGMLRQRSLGWWGLVLCSLLALGAYIIFDVLDVDGSDLQKRILRNPMASQAVEAETKRALHQNSAAPDVLGHVSVSVVLQPLSTSVSVSPHTIPGTFGARLARVHLRLYPSRDTLPAPSPTDDRT